MIRRLALLLTIVATGATQMLEAQRSAVGRYDDTLYAGVQRTAYSVQQDFWRRSVPHYGKWLAAAGVAALTVVGASEHRRSRRDWDALLTICRSALDACALGADGRYARSDAELLYQRSRVYDRRASRWLLGAQAALIATAALFIVDLHPGQGPENIPFPASRIEVRSMDDGVAVGLRLAF